MKSTLPDFKIRLPQELKDEIEAAARKNNRSMNGEIVARLEATFAIGITTFKEGGFDVPVADDVRLERRTEALEKLVAELQEKVRKLSGE